MPDDIATRPAARASVRAAFQPSSFNADARTVDLVWSTGAPVQRTDWWEGTIWTEVLDMSPEAVDLSRLNGGAPLLNAHSAYDLGDVIGVVERAWLDGGRGYATVRFSDRDEVAPIVQDVRAGILRNISIGYQVARWETQAASASQGEVRTARAWTPYEVSLVPIPADPQAQTRALPADAVPAPSRSHAASAANMEPEMPDPSTSAPAQPGTDIDAATRAAVAGERQRVAEIGRVAAQAGLGRDFADQHILAGTSVDAVRAAALDALEARAAAPVPPGPAARITRDEGETQWRGLAGALETRGRLPTEAPAELVAQFRGASMLDVARACLELRGAHARGLSKMEVFERAMKLHDRTGLVRDGGGAMAVGDFPNLLANVANKSLRMGYSTAARTFPAWTSQHDLPDFKSFREVALGGAPKLAKIAEGGEVEYGSVGDAAEIWNLFRYGKALGITFEAMINDDLGGFTRLPQMFGAASARLESETVYGLLEANANMADGNPLFGAAHANYASGGTSALTVDAAGVAAVGALQQRLRKQTAPNGDILNLTGAFLVTPAELETAAAQLFASRLVPATAGAVNPFAEGGGSPTLRVISDGRLTSATAFYMMANPAEIDTVHWGYLAGESGPRVSSELDFDTDGMKLKCIHIFGAKAIDWRGMAKSAGA